MCDVMRYLGFGYENSEIYRYLRTIKKEGKAIFKRIKRKRGGK